MTKLGSTTFEFDPACAPSLNVDEREAIRTLAALPDDQIDTSDIPSWTDDLAAGAVRNPFLKRRRAVTVSLDDDIVVWLGPDGGERDAKLTVLLREAMSRERTG